MTKTIKRFIFVVAIIAAFAAATTSAFAMPNSMVDSKDMNKWYGSEAFYAELNQYGFASHDWARPVILAAREYGNMGFNREDGTVAHGAVDFTTSANQYNVMVAVDALLRLHSDIEDACHHDFRHRDPEMKKPFENRAFCELNDAGVLTPYNGIFNFVRPRQYQYMEYEYETDSYAKVTRQELAMLLANSAKYVGLDDNKNIVTFNDAAAFKSDDAKAAAQFMVNLGVMSADANGNFNPAKEVSYEEATCFIYRVHILMLNLEAQNA